MRTFLVLLACVLAAGTVGAGREMVAIRVSPNVSMAPATVRVFVTVEPDAKNRQLVMEADSGLFYTSSTVQLDGDKAARSQAFLLKDLPAGTYEVAARVIQANGDARKAGASYMVLE